MNIARNSTKCWICNKVYVENDVKVKDHCLVTGKYIGFAHGDLISILYETRKIPVVFLYLKNFDFHLIMQELGKFNL